MTDNLTGGILMPYNLGFVSDDNIFNHVAQTVATYRFNIDLRQFNKNLVDPIKLTFDSRVYGKSLEELIESECIRQVDKSNENTIGYFHQKLFNYIGNGWVVPLAGFDVENVQRNIFVEIKNKHNTMNSASAQKTYMKMQDKILRNDRAVCYLAEVIAKTSQDIPWTISLDGQRYVHNNIRRISMDKFYELATADSQAFKKLCQALPTILDDVIEQTGHTGIQNTVFNELHALSPNILKSLYLLAFRRYEGFNTFEV